MEQQIDNRQLAVVPRERANKPHFVLALLDGVLLIALLAGCWFVYQQSGQDKVWPHTLVHQIDVSGLTFQEAETKVKALTSGNGIDTILFVRDGSDEVVGSMDPTNLMAARGVAEQLRASQNDGRILVRGVHYLKSVLGMETEMEPIIEVTQQGKEIIEQTVAAISHNLGVDGNQTTWEAGDTEVTFTKGRTSSRVDADALVESVMAVIGKEKADIVIPVVVENAPPEDPDFDAVAAAVHVDAADAYLDKNTGKVVESVVGKNLDVTTARLALGAIGEGESCTVALDLTQPQMTTEVFNGLLFRDVLAEAATKVTGTADRVDNVKRAAKLVNGSIVVPGDEFSFNQKCSPYSQSNGYGKATAYVNGLSVDTVAGGICQASSTLYWATLKANLKTLERNAHRYEPSYIKGGLDATVYGNYGTQGSLDFRFKNSTKHPIKVEVYVDKSNYIHVVIRGTDDTGIHGEPYSTNRVVTQAYKTVYEASSRVPQGTLQKDRERTGYTGVNIDTYQKLVDSNGATVSEVKLYTNKYAVRNEVYLYNPADKDLWGISANGTRTASAGTGPSGSSAQSGSSSGEASSTTQSGSSSGGSPSTSSTSRAPQKPKEDEPVQPPVAPTTPAPTPAPVVPTPAPVPDETEEEPLLPPGV